MCGSMGHAKSALLINKSRLTNDDGTATRSNTMVNECSHWPFNHTYNVGVGINNFKKVNEKSGEEWRREEIRFFSSLVVVQKCPAKNVYTDSFFNHFTINNMFVQKEDGGN